MYVGVDEGGMTWSPVIELKPLNNKDSKDYYVEVEMNNDHSVNTE